MNLNLEQGSPEWLEFRKTRIGASDSPIIMGVSPWKTPYQLWREKLFGEETKKTYWMQRGNDLEDSARQEYEYMTNSIVFPTVRVHPEYEWCIASLDGIDMEGQRMVEIKCCGHKDHTTALGGQVPEKYMPQLQHQMAVTGLDRCHYFSFDGEEGVIIEVERDEQYIKTMLDRELSFYNCLINFTAPDLTDRDFVHRTDEAFSRLASEYKLLYAEQKEIEAQLENVKKDLIALADGKNCKNDLVQISRVVRKGTVDYKAIPELMGVDLEPYRKKPMEFFKIS